MADDIKVSFDLDIGKDIIVNLNKINASIDGIAKQNLNGINNGFGKLALGLTALKSAVDLAQTAISKLSYPVQQAMEQEKAEVLLANALKATAGATQETLTKMIEYSDVLSRQTGIQDDAILNAQRFLVQMGLTGDQLNQVTKAAMDYSVAMGTDFQTATEQIGRVIEGSATRLGRFNLGLKETSTQAERTTAVLTFMNEKGFSGAAAANVDTFGGALNLVKNGFYEMLEGIGNFIIKSPAMLTLFKKLGEVLYGVAGAFKDMLPFVLKVENAILYGVSKALQTFYQWLTKIFSFLAKAPGWLGGDAFKFAADSFQQASDQVKVFAEEVKKLPDKKEIKVEFKAPKEMEKTGFAKLQEQIMGLFSFKGAGQLASSIGQGAAGANKLVSGGAAMAANVFIPGSGEAVGPIIEFLSKTPEEFKKQTQEFFAQLSKIPAYIIENIPVFVEELLNFLTEGIPDLVQNIVDVFSQEEFWSRIVDTAVTMLADPTLWLRVAVSATDAFIQSIPKIVDAMANAVANKLNELLGKIGLGDNGITSAGSLKRIGLAVGTGGMSEVARFAGIKFAEGGVVPDNPKFNNDRFPARLSAGERVLTKEQNQKLEAMLGERNMTVNLVVGESQLASVLLRLNQQGFRTA